MDSAKDDKNKPKLSLVPKDIITNMARAEEEVMCIRYHMGAFTDSGEWNYYTRAIHKYPNVLWSHHADMIAAHIIER